jgi:chaperonin GroEL (HSP60 family)
VYRRKRNLRRAIQMPAKQIAINAGEDGGVMVGKLLEKEDGNWGYNAATSNYQDNPVGVKGIGECRDSGRGRQRGLSRNRRAR